VPNRDKIALILAGGEIIHKRVPPGAEAVPLEGEGLTACFSAETQEKAFVVDWSYQPVSHYTLRMCSDLIQLAGPQIEEGAAGVVITVGTQALTEAAYFAELVWNYPQPLVFTASICYAGTPEVETKLRLHQSVQAAASQSSWGQGPLICVQDELYAAADLCQLSNYSRMGFVSLPCGPLARFCEPGSDLIVLRSTRRSGRVMDIGTLPARNIEILEASLGGGDILLNALLESRVSDLDGLVVSAFGGGDVPPSWAPLLRKIMRAGVPVVLTSRCPVGRVQSGRDYEGAAARLLEMGLIDGGTLTPLQARIRLAMGLGAELKDQELRTWMLDE
jgi:L-asparaginase